MQNSRWDAFQNRMWSNRQIPYVLSPLYSAEDQIVIMMAIRTVNFLTCLKFVEWNRNDTDFLLIWPIQHPKGCWSYIGKTGGPQIVSLQPPDQKSQNCLGSEGRALHELMHAIGIFHEQSRHDRDRYKKLQLKLIFLPVFIDVLDSSRYIGTTSSKVTNQILRSKASRTPVTRSSTTLTRLCITESIILARKRESRH